MTTVDLTKTLKTLYAAKRKPEVVTADTGTFLAIEGCGAPGQEEFQSAIQSLFVAAYTIKFMVKLGGGLDFKVGRLECLYYSTPNTPMSSWQWRLLIRIPDEITSRDLARARQVVQDRKGMDISAVRRIRWKEGRALQILHVGPYNEVAKIYERLGGFAQEHGLELAGPAHEIYLNDPRRLDPQKLKTIVRLSAKKRSCR